MSFMEYKCTHGGVEYHRIYHIKRVIIEVDWIRFYLQGIMILIVILQIYLLYRL